LVTKEEQGVEKTKTMEESTLNSRSRETEVLGRKKDTKVRVSKCLLYDESS
jgi:hypothetical protein